MADKFFAKLEEWKKEQDHSGGIFAQNTKIGLKSVQTKLGRFRMVDVAEES